MGKLLAFLYRMFPYATRRRARTFEEFVERVRESTCVWVEVAPRLAYTESIAETVHGTVLCIAKMQTGRRIGFTKTVISRHGMGGNEEIEELFLYAAGIQEELRRRLKCTVHFEQLARPDGRVQRIQPWMLDAIRIRVLRLLDAT